MINFRSFPKIKTLLRTAALTGLLLNLQSIWGTDYTWTGGGGPYTNWKTSANWTPSTGYPGQNSADTATFTGSSEITVTLDSDLTVSGLNFNTAGSSKITLNLNSHNLTCSGTLLLVHITAASQNGNVTLTGNGIVKTSTFDIPSGNDHLFQIEENSKLKITSNLWADGSGKLTFRGDGYLYLPTGGANVNNGYNGITELLYEIPASHRLPYEAEGEEVITPIYTCTIGTIPDTFPADPATVSFTGGEDVRFPYKVIITGSDTYQIGSQVFNNSTGSFSAPGKKYKGGYRPSNPDASILKGGENYNLKCTSGAITTPKNGITIIFYSPDGGDDPDKSFMEMGRISWHYQTPTWTGAAGDKKWTNKNNWSYTGITGFDPKNLQEYSIEISETNTNKQPVIDEDVSVKELTISAGSSVTHTDGKLSINKLITAGTSKFTSSGGIVEVKKFDDSQDAPTFTADFPGFISINTLSIAEGTPFSLPFDMSLNMLILNSGCTFSKNSKNLTLGWLQAQTSSYTSPASKDITLSDSFEADSIIFLLRDGNIIAKENLTARKDIIISGPNYNSSSLKYQHFTRRPYGWVQSFTETSLDINSGDPVSSSSTLSIAAGKNLTAGTSGKGNFYINGATLTGSSGNNLVIPKNNSPENFCAEAVNSTISNITVTCADGTSDGSHAQIPATDCTLSSCTNFDDSELEIEEAYTVSDCRIYIKFPREIRKITYLHAIKASDGTAFTAEYSSKTGTEAPAALKTSLYLYTENTSWNTDASGTSIGSGNYTNHLGFLRDVKASLTIPQYITNTSGDVYCGYVITDKWGKRLKSYSPEASAYTSVSDGIPENEKHVRMPPAFSSVLSSVGSNKLTICFSKPIVIDSSKISYIKNALPPVQEDIDQPMNRILPRCFEIISINPDGSPEVAPDGIQIDRGVNAQIQTFSSGLSAITLQLTRAVTLEDIENLYVRLISPKKDDNVTLLYPETTYDHVSGRQGTMKVTFIQESNAEHTSQGATFMLLDTAHTISDFALGAVTTSYAYISDSERNDIDSYKNVYSSDSIAVHDFSKNQKNYGSLPYGYGFEIVSKINTGKQNPQDSDFPGGMKLFITDNPDSSSIFNIFNSNYDKSANCWLPGITAISDKEFESYTPELNQHFWSLSESKTIANGGFSFSIPKDDVLKMKPSQLSFLYALCDANGAYIQHFRSPLYDYSSQRYTLDPAKSCPLFAFNLSNTSDLLCLSPWYITLKSITEQRGGVTILNNVINAANGEKTVLKVNMPSSGNLDVMIMTLDGNIVKYLTHGSASAGEHFYYWDGKNNAGSAVARGMYFVIVKAPGIDETRKVMVVK
ncbi:FlgD immunoglobulin-like domain containing protein [Treponema sp. C6A8]|uniref:FlgD immunoglobulin-like domain containing protein n=1 Tax=Treponema sp. C6A8 TaxID=1410609 RepID=UPI0004822037|nr:FlgD immunoglobulin-like domain containing protein [Treponema sp. C6A8]